ncbi:hypothetical protein [Streptomyces sp. NPDC059278]|uniref:hypothetical protein n=1 Tax=Streptomyces sp. NPDC059278 TaxID=3346801 RepID=UPI0036B942A4
MANIEIIETVTVTVVRVEVVRTVTVVADYTPPFGLCEDCGWELEIHCNICDAVYCEACEYGA